MLLHDMACRHAAANRSMSTSHVMQQHQPRCCEAYCPTKTAVCAVRTRYIKLHDAALQTFNYIITAVIVVNIVILASTVYNESTAFTNAKEDCNYAFTAIFIIEAAIKITGLGWRSYWRSGWNKFDFFLIIMAIVDIGFTEIASHGSQVGHVARHAGV